MLTIRKTDPHGSGEYYASRLGGKNHAGVDLVFNKYQDIHALNDGIVTKIGIPYTPNGTVRDKLKYVQISDQHDLRVRYFYCKPAVVIGQIVSRGDFIGTCQNLEEIYPGITNHIHFEVLLMIAGKKVFINPIDYLKALGHVYS